MTAPPNNTTTDTYAIVVALRGERDAALAREAALAKELVARTVELTQRNSEYGERIDHQAATIDVLEAMSASPADPQPVFNLIARRARNLCNGAHVGLFEFDGALVHIRAWSGTYHAGIETRYPKLLTRETISGRAILERRIIHIRDADADLDLLEAIREAGSRSILSVPLMRDNAAIGAISLNAPQRGGFSDGQVELLRAFAEQAVIAISSAETYRALQARTADLQESLEYQTATSDVLKVISRSTFDLQPVLTMVAETATRLCAADQAAIFLREGDISWLAANFGYPPEYEARVTADGPNRVDPTVPAAGMRAIVEGRVVHIPDAAAVPGYWEVAITLGKQRTALGVPLMREGNAIGCIILARQRVEPFADRQIELVSTFADQAVIAIENTRLLTEQQESLEHQTATSDVLQVINASPGNLAPVFDAMLERALHLCESAFGVLATYDGEAFHHVALRGVTPELAEFLRQPFRSGPGLALHRVLQGEDVVQVADIVNDDAYRSGIPGRRAMADLGGARTQLLVALRKDEVLLGVLLIFRQEVRPFTEKQIVLLRNFAAQAVIAMENARLITEQREALEQQTATAEVLQVINASPGNLAPVFDAILEKAHTFCGAPLGSLVLCDGEQLRAVATRGYPPGYETLARQGFSPIPPFKLLVSGELFVHVPDTATWPGVPNEEDDLMRRAAIEIARIRTALFVPLRKNTTVLGYISAQRQEKRPFTDEQIALLQNFAAQAVIAMENARLITEQREALEQQTATAEVLQVINASPGDLQPVFDTMLEKAMRLCGGTIGGIFTFDEDHSVTSAVRGVTAAFEQYNNKYPMDKIQPGTLPARIIETRGPVQYADVTASEPYRAGRPYARALVEFGGIRATLAVPLLKDGVAVGMVAIYRQEVGAFSDKQIVLLQNFAAQAVIAMENARLSTEQREALEQQTATAEVLQVINANPGNLAPVFETILEMAHSLCNVAVGSLSVYVDGLVHTAATRGFSDEYQALLRRPYPAIGSHQALMRGGPSRQTPDFRTVPVSPEMASSLDHIERMNLRTGLWVPLRKDGTALGCISLYRDKVQPFSEKEIALLQNFAAQAVIAMENARLLDEIRQRQEELRVTFENMGDGVAMFDETQHLVAWNRKFQDIVDVPDDIIARRQTFSEYVRYLAERGEYGFGGDPEEQVRRLIEQAGQARTYERTRPDGRVIEIRHNPVAGGGFVLIYADITERKQNEAEIRAARDAAEEASRTIEAAFRELKAAQANLIQVEKMASLGQLTAGIAHEIKNPLNFVNNFAALSVDLLAELKETATPGFAALTQDQRAEIEDVSAMLTSNLEKITEHGKRADGIVKAMLEHSRGSSAERRMVDLNGLIDEAMNLAYHGARAQDQSFDITLERDFGEGIAPIEVNPQDMTRVFLNIFGNGFYAATRRARNGGDAGFEPMLKVTTRDAGEAVEIRVRDNGTGIRADIRDKLFQPFFTTKPTGEGTGLGLSITYDIVTKAHGGSICVDSEVGEYSEFTIRLPRSR